MAESAVETQRLLDSSDPMDSALLVGECYKQFAEFYRSDHERILRARRYALDGQHWKTTRGETGDLLDFKPSLGHLFRFNQHIAAQIASAEDYISAVPVDAFGDSDTAENAERVLKILLEQQRFAFVKRQVIADAVNAAIGMARLQALAGFGPFGVELQIQKMDPTHGGPCPGFLDPHHPLCPWFIDLIPMQHAEVMRLGRLPADEGGWDVPADLQPDVQARDNVRGSAVYGAQANLPMCVAAENMGGDIVWVGVLWHKRDITTTSERKVKPLREADRFFMCSLCRHMMPAMAGLPEAGPMCPSCGQGQMMRVDTREEVRTVPLYPRGKLIIAPVHQPQLKPFYRGRWPERDLGGGRVIGLRTFPYLVYTQHLDPRKLIPKSNTELHEDEQFMLDVAHMLGFHQLVRNQDHIKGIDGSLYGANGRPFELRRDPREWWMGVRAAQGVDAATAAAAVQHFQGSGISPGLPPFIGMLRSDMETTKGTFTPPQTAEGSAMNIPVGTVQEYVRSGEVAVADAVDLWRMQLRPFLGSALDWWMVIATEKRAHRYFGPEGKALFADLEGADIPQVDVLVMPEPRLQASKMAEAEAMQKILALPSKAQRHLMWEAAGLPAKRLAEYEADLAKEQAAMQPPVPGQPPPAMAGANGGMNGY